MIMVIKAYFYDYSEFLYYFWVSKMCVQEKKEVRRQVGRIVSEADEISLEVIGRQERVASYKG